jgi:hypothetical protein
LATVALDDLGALVGSSINRFHDFVETLTGTDAVSLRVSLALDLVTIPLIQPSLFAFLAMFWRVTPYRFSK